MAAEGGRDVCQHPGAKASSDLGGRMIIVRVRLAKGPGVVVSSGPPG